MAWSPLRRANTGISRVEHPGDYATSHSHYLRDGTESYERRDCERVSALNLEAISPALPRPERERAGDEWRRGELGVGLSAEAQSRLNQLKSAGSAGVNWPHRYSCLRVPSCAF